MKENKQTKQSEKNVQATSVQVTNPNPETKESKKKSKAKKVQAKSKELPKVKKNKVVKEVAEQQKVSLLEQVVAHREVKWIYPEDVTDTLSRKTWRQRERNKLHKLELALNRIKDTNSKEYKQALKAFEDKKKQVLKPGQTA